MKKIIYCSQFSDSSGYAVAARGYLKAIDKIIKETDICLKIYDLSVESVSFLNESEKKILDKYSFKSTEEINDFIKSDYKCLWHYPSGFLELCSNYKGLQNWDTLDLLIKSASENINYVTWEADLIPDNWINIYEKYKTKKIITSSTWNKKIFEKSVNIPVYVLHHVVEEKENKSIKIKELENVVENKFVIFSMSQWQTRKGFDKLIQSYLMEFKKQDDVLLIIKTYGQLMNNYAYTKEFQINSIREEINNYKNSVFINNGELPTAKIIALCDVLPYEKISWLYSISDIFALLTRGEGFGLTIADAILNKKPVLVTEGSGHMDLIDEKSSFLVKSNLHPFINKAEYNCDMNWYEPDFLSARKQLRNAYDIWKKDKKLLKNMGNNACKKINKMGLKSETIGYKLLEILDEPC